MLHRMNLWHDSFEKIAAGTKKIEMRLQDEKRSRISPGDQILFTDISNQRQLLCTVVALYRYVDFEALYQNHEKEAIGYRKDEIALSADMLQYYTEEQTGRYGVLGIEVAVMTACGWRKAFGRAADKKIPTRQKFRGGRDRVTQERGWMYPGEEIPPVWLGLLSASGGSSRSRCCCRRCYRCPHRRS